MVQLIIDNLNCWAVLVAGLAHFVFGLVWFGVFYNLWSVEIARHGVTIAAPTKQRMARNLLVTFVGALITAFAVAVVVLMAHSHTVVSALKVGLFCGAGFSAVTLGVVYHCEGKPYKLFLIDAGNAVIGTVICSIILSLWR